MGHNNLPSQPAGRLEIRNLSGQELVSSLTPLDDFVGEQDGSV
jgi:hypothetical protein